MADRYVYLDNAASSLPRRAAVEAEHRYLDQRCAGANPNSLHTLGRESARMLDAARATLANIIGHSFKPADISFTSGGTEANALCVLGMAEGMRRKDRSRTRVIISAIEHDSVLELASPLKERGFEVDILKPSRKGELEPSALSELIGEDGGDVALVSCMAANNETGVVQPIAKLARLAHDAGALFHTDAVQAFLKVPLELADVDALSITAHKLGGPVGTGAMCIRSRTPYSPQSFGGGQENGRRSGTQDVSGALAFAAVADELAPTIDERAEATRALGARIVERLCTPDSPVHTTVGEDVQVLDGIVHLLISGADSESLILHLDNAGFCVSAGSACSSGSLEPSHVLRAMGIARNDAFGALRISFDERTTLEDIDAFCDAVLAVLPSILG